MKYITFLSLFLFCLFATGHAEQECCKLRKQLTRSDNIPCDHITAVDDDYLTGYLQALLDMHYYEFQVRVIVLNQEAYLFHLPYNSLVAYSVMCFVADIPCIKNVERICGSPQALACTWQECAPEKAACLESSTAYQSICSMDCRECRVKGVWMPQTTVLFAPLIADPRQPMNAAALRFNDNVIGKYVGAPSFGGDFIIYRWKDVLCWHGDMDIGVQAGIFNVFDLDNPEACMVNTDFFVALLLTYAFDRWSFRFRLWHLSCHIGDEFLICNPGFDRYNLSDEGVDFFASYYIVPAVRLYAGIGDIFSRDKEFPEDPIYFEAGTEIRVFGRRNRFDRLYVQPFLAMHFRSWQEHNWDVDQTYALGVEWSKLQGIGRKFRLYLEYHNGYSKEGQFVRERSDYLAIKTSYSF